MRCICVALPVSLRAIMATLALAALGSACRLGRRLDLPLLALGRAAWLVNPTHRRLQQARARLPHLRVKTWRL